VEIVNIPIFPVTSIISFGFNYMVPGSALGIEWFDCKELWINTSLGVIEFKKKPLGEIRSKSPRGPIWDWLNKEWINK
jgi:hypothetical protein